MSVKANTVCRETLYGINNVMKELDTNHLATDFIAENYDNMILAAKKMGVNPDMAHDIVHDVYMSIQKNEENGEGYNPNKGNIGEYISVEEFVYGRLKGYSLNKKYRSISDELIKARPENYDEVLKGNKNIIVEIPSCSSAIEFEDMTFYQKAYESAANYDDLDSIDLELSVTEELEYCLTFESNIKMNLRFFLKNLHNIATMNIDTSVFKELKNMGSNTEFVDSLRSLVDYAKASPDKYEALVAGI